MKRGRSVQTGQRPAKRSKLQRQDATVTSVVRKELRKQIDWKYCDNNAQLPVYNLGTITSLFSNLVRGDNGLNNFQGNDLRPQAITLKYYATTSQVYNTYRVLIFQWFESAAPALAGLLQTGATGYALVAPTLVTNKKYIKILYDRTHMNNIPYSGGNSVMDPVTVYIPGKRLKPVRYNQNTNTCQDGNIYICLVSDDTALGTIDVTYWTRVTFSD